MEWRFPDEALANVPAERVTNTVRQQSDETLRRHRKSIVRVGQPRSQPKLT